MLSTQAANSKYLARDLSFSPLDQRSDPVICLELAMSLAASVHARHNFHEVPYATAASVARDIGDQFREAYFKKFIVDENIPASIDVATRADSRWVDSVRTFCARGMTYEARTLLESLSANFSQWSGTGRALQAVATTMLVTDRVEGGEPRRVDLPLRQELTGYLVAAYASVGATVLATQLMNHRLSSLEGDGPSHDGGEVDIFGQSALVRAHVLAGNLAEAESRVQGFVKIFTCLHQSDAMHLAMGAALVDGKHFEEAHAYAQRFIETEQGGRGTRGERLADFCGYLSTEFSIGEKWRYAEFWKQAFLRHGGREADLTKRLSARFVLLGQFDRAYEAALENNDCAGTVLGIATAEAETPQGGSRRRALENIQRVVRGDVGKWEHGFNRHGVVSALAYLGECEAAREVIDFAVSRAEHSQDRECMEFDRTLSSALLGRAEMLATRSPHYLRYYQVLRDGYADAIKFSEAASRFVPWLPTRE